MTAIRLQFVLASSLSSRLIAWYGQGYGGFSHVDAVLPDGSLLGARSDAIGGKPPGVQVRPPFYERWLRRSVVTLQVDQKRSALWAAWLRGEIGRKYDDRAILGFLLGRRWHRPDTWICSALQTQALRHVNWMASPGVPDAQVTPDTLHAICLAAGATASEYEPSAERE